MDFLSNTIKEKQSTGRTFAAEKSNQMDNSVRLPIMKAWLQHESLQGMSDKIVVLLSSC
jgi:hypothetical protein